MAAQDAAFSASIMTVSALAIGSGAVSDIESCATAYEQQHANAAAASRVV
ncbi:MULTISPECIES: hypothetical protein [Burkholderia]